MDLILTNVACLAGGIADARNKVLAAESLIAGGRETLFLAPTIPPATQATANDVNKFSGWKKVSELEVTISLTLKKIV